MYLFVSLSLYMFRTAQCSSSGAQLYSYIVWYVLVYMTAWYAGLEGSPDDEHCAVRNM